jgi:hypothetical protein
LSDITIGNVVSIPTQGRRSKDIPALETADRTSQLTDSNSSLGKDSQEAIHLPNEEDIGTIGTSSSTPAETVPQKQTEEEFEISMQEFDADMAKQELAERQAFLAVVRHRSDIPTSDIEDIMSQMDIVYKIINDNQLLGKFDKHEEKTHISNLNEMCQQAPMDEEIATAIFIAFEKDGQRQVIIDSEASQAARCWNKFLTHCLTNYPMYKQPRITIESVPLVAEELFRKLQKLLDSLVKILFNVDLSSPGKAAEYSKFHVVQQDYKYNTIPTQNTQKHIMAEEA